MQNEIIDTIRLDITKSSTNICVYVRKADTRTLEIYLTNNGNVVDLTQAIFAAIYIEKEEETLYQTVIRDGNKLRYTFHDEDVDSVGEMRCRVVISFKDKIQITSPAFAMIVQEMPEIPLSSSEDLTNYNAITAALSDANSYAAIAKENAEKAESTFEDAKVVYEDVQKLLESSEVLVDLLEGIEPVTEADVDAMWAGEWVPENDSSEEDSADENPEDNSSEGESE